KAIAAAGLVAGLSRETRATASSAGPVAIVGGGIAGLTALWTLTHAGVDARLYEARPRLGGRMYTARMGAAGALEMGGQLVNTEHHDMAELARTFGVGLIDRKAGRFRSLILADGRPVDEADAAAAMRGIAAQMTKDADRLDRDQAHVAAELDQLSFATYLNRYAAKMPEPWVRRLIETTARTEYGVEPAQASAIELMFNLPSVEGARVDVLSRSDERYVIAGGSSALIDAMAARMARRIASGRKVAAIDPLPSDATPATRPSGVRLVFADGRHIDAAAVIVTTPASITRRIAFGVPLPPLWKRFIAEANLGRNEKVQATMKVRPWEAVTGRGGNLWHTPASAGGDAVASGWDGTVRPHSGGAIPGGDWTWYMGGEEVEKAAVGEALAQAHAFAREVEAGVPGMATAITAARRTAWHGDPMTRGGYINYRPGQLTRFAPLIWVEEHGRAARPVSSGLVHFAGEHLSDAFPGYMNGAAQTGRLAAEAVMAQLAERMAR
ncbi:flavin monoamine oxidase family protein, partial [Sphingomonas bacterium]|uniref:flavin monoamine oxidase family protein n=1 Tax=Sphingomonas bacterium TaxID=1895847 RepID=UPI001575DCB6